jgi:putative transposase
MCKVLSVSKSGFYKWLNRKPSRRDIENDFLLEEIRKVHKNSYWTYGSPRIAAELNSRDIKVSRPRVARIMKSEGIKSRIRRKFVNTTDSKHGFVISENLLNREFSVTELGKVWISDITYIKTAAGWLYLTIIMDLADRKIIGWALSKGMSAEETVIKAFLMAIKNRAILKGLIFHSDRGVQYACKEFRSLLESYSVTQSMSRKGNCWDNAVAESFFKSLKQNGYTVRIINLLKKLNWTSSFILSLGITSIENIQHFNI